MTHGPMTKASRPIPHIREGLQTTPGPPGGPPDHTRNSGRASLPLPDLREGLPAPP